MHEFLSKGSVISSNSESKVNASMEVSENDSQTGYPKNNAQLSPKSTLARNSQTFPDAPPIYRLR